MKKGQIYSKFEVPEIFQTIQVRREAEGKGKPFDVEEIFDHKFKEGKAVGMGKKKKKTAKEDHQQVFKKKKAFSYDYQKY